MEPLPCPPGLEILQDTTHLFIKQCVEITEALTGFETQNKYEIQNSSGERVFYCVESTNSCLLCCSRVSRPFKFKILDYTGKRVMTIRRPCSCLNCCCGWRLCCFGIFGGSKINIALADGSQLGQVSEGWNICTPKFNVKGQNSESLQIAGPSCAFCCNCKLMGNVEFEIRGEGDVPCGRISKEFDGVPTVKKPGDADNYGICFPKDMSPGTKAVLLGAVILIDFLYFEENQKKGAE